MRPQIRGKLAKHLQTATWTHWRESVGRFSKPSHNHQKTILRRFAYRPGGWATLLKNKREMRGTLRGHIMRKMTTMKNEGCVALFFHRACIAFLKSMESNELSV